MRINTKLLEFCLQNQLRKLANLSVCIAGWENIFLSNYLSIYISWSGNTVAGIEIRLQDGRFRSSNPSFGQMSLLQNVQPGARGWGKATGVQFGHQHLYNGKVKNEWSYTFNTPLCLYVVDEKNIMAR